MGIDATALSRWIELEEIFQPNEYRGASSGPFAELLIRNSRALLVATHSVQHYRGRGSEDLQGPDLRTGGLVLMLGERLKISTVVNRRTTPEINPHNGTTLADRLIAQYIQRRPDAVIFDIQGMADGASIEIALRTGLEEKNQIAWAEHLSRAFKPLIAATNVDGLCGRSPNSVTARAISAGAKNAIQIEISATCRKPDADPLPAWILLYAFEAILSDALP